MLIASNRGAGQNMGMPDVCLTPSGPAVVPVPYPNIAMNAQAVAFVVKVILRGMNALNMGSKIPMTSGDEGGVAHPTIKGMGQWTTGCMKVMLQALPAITLTSPSTGNMMNNGVGLQSVPSATNCFFTLRVDEGGSAIDARVMDADARETHALVTARGELHTRWLTEGVAAIRIDVVARDVPAKLFNAIRTLGGELRGLVLDLRQCPGGDLSVMSDLAGDFLPAGATVITVIESDGDETVFRSRHEQRYAMPLAIVVDEMTASAAELFAGCLQCHGRAVIVGATTYGKATVQGFDPVPIHGQSVYRTRARCLLPDGRDIEGRGVTPDLLSESDPVAAAALAVSPLE